MAIRQTTTPLAGQDRRLGVAGVDIAAASRRARMSLIPDGTSAPGAGVRGVPILPGDDDAEARYARPCVPVTDDEATELLRSLPVTEGRSRPTATRVVRHRGGGGSDAWDIAVGSTVYVTKFANNPQEPQDRTAPRKIVVTELIVGRVGQLFRDPVCPETCVITVPRALIEAEPIRMGGGLAEEGAALGSLVIPHATETKSGGPLSSVPPTRLATILAFQALMQVDDAAALVRDDGAWAHSIDHGHYFGGGSWGSHHGPAAERPQINPMSGLDMGPFRVRSVWDQAVADLDAIDDEALARAFTDVPVEWGCDIQFLGPLLGATSRRRERLREVIDDYC